MYTNSINLKRKLRKSNESNEFTRRGREEKARVKVNEDLVAQYNKYISAASGVSASASADVNARTHARLTHWQ